MSRLCLPPGPTLPLGGVARRHRPKTIKKSGRYTVFRPCLRWEFGFTCAFCLLHESDLAEFGVERTGITSIEHFIPQSTPGIGKKLARKYSNCFYACRYCNNTRLNKPNQDALGRNLLDPSVSPWGANFLVVGDSLQPANPDAAYTAEAYGINDPIRLQIRKARRERLDAALHVASAGRARLVALATAAPAAPGSPEELIRNIGGPQKLIDAADKAFDRHQAVPATGVPKKCRCTNKKHRTLPPWMLGQLQTINF